MKCTPKVRQTIGGAFCMEKATRRNKRYSAEFKISVILDMREHGLSYCETMRKYFPHLHQKNFAFLKKWERIFLEEGELGLMKERRGRATKADKPNIGRPRKKPLPAETENDLIAENQRLKEQLEYLQMENQYLKKLNALIRAEEQKNGRKPK